MKDPKPAPPKPAITPEQAAILLKSNQLNIAKKVGKGSTLSAQEIAILTEAQAATGDPSEPAKKPKIQSIRQIAHSAGISANSIAKYMSMDGAPAKQAGGYNTLEVLEFIAENSASLKTGARVGSELHELTKRSLELRNERLQLVIKKERGEMVPKSEIGPALRNLALRQRALLLRKYEQELAPKLAGRTTVEMLELIRVTNDEVVQAFSEGTRAWMDDDEEHDQGLPQQANQ